MLVVLLEAIVEILSTELVSSLILQFYDLLLWLIYHKLQNILIKMTDSVTYVI